MAKQRKKPTIKKPSKKKKKSTGKKRPLNDFMKALKKARADGANSFEYTKKSKNGKKEKPTTYVRSHKINPKTGKEPPFAIYKKK